MPPLDRNIIRNRDNGRLSLQITTNRIGVALTQLWSTRLAPAGRRRRPSSNENHARSILAHGVAAARPANEASWREHGPK